ncbi:MAG: rhomboid family intramembrane serine protease [Gammaproteobacteria bacterium]|nr:rhomboid family intramembrane serine protease [Gammaproteobacteria bacterium]
MHANWRERSSERVRPVLMLLAIIWLVEIVNLLLGHGLGRFGIVPRTLDGLVGIPFAPLLHASLGHALVNSMPLLVLGVLVAAHGRRSFVQVTVVVAVLGGLGVWLIGRPGSHVGASGLIFGYFGYLLGCALFRRELLSMLIAGVALLLYGGLILGVLPVSGPTSWEGHLFGLLAGGVVAWLEAPRR